MRRAAALALILAACSPAAPTIIDGSSPDRFAASVDQARGDLPVADRLVFDRAIQTIGGRRYAAKDSQALARLTFDGMTAAEIVADQRARER